MAMPVNDKTWVFNVNNEVQTGNNITDLQETVYSLYDSMITFGCTPMGCCWWNGSTYAISTPGDGVKNGRWTASSEAEWRTHTTFAGNKSWAVLRFPSKFGATTDIVFQCYRNTTSYTSMQVFTCAYGYNIATGTVALRPAVSSGTEFTITNVTTGIATGNFIDNGTAKRIWNTAMSSDGDCFRFWILNAGKTICDISLEKMKNPVPGLTSGGKTNDWHLRFNAQFVTAATEVCTLARLYTSTITYTNGFLSDGNIYPTYYYSGECRAGATTPMTNFYVDGTNPQDSSSYPLLPIGIVSGATDLAYSYGRMGEIYDMWWGATNLITGTTFPGDGSKTHIMLGNIVIPWDAGVVPIIT
jgi:hypothetical protein